MSIIKEIHLLGELPEVALEKIEQAAQFQFEKNNVRFKILECSPEKVMITVKQTEFETETYFSKKELITIARSIFDKYFPGRKVVMVPLNFIESPASKIDYKWIQQKMIATDTDTNDFCAATGLSKADVNDFIHGNKRMPQHMRALFWFYFAFLEK